MNSIQNVGVRRSLDPTAAQTQTLSHTKPAGTQGAAPVDVTTLSAAASLLTIPSSSRIPELKAAFEAGVYEPDSAATAAKIITAVLTGSFGTLNPVSPTS